jgi:hypothetical protein
VSLRGRSTPLDLYVLEKLRFEDQPQTDEATDISVVRW